MKAYLKILPYLGIALGLLGLLICLSFTSLNACLLANSDINTIKAETQKGLEVQSLKMVKYHAFKALNHLEKTKQNLNDCGCETAVITAKDAAENLKIATKSNSLEDSKSYLKLALQHTLITLDALENYDPNYESAYGDDILVLNTKEVLNEQGGILMSPAKELQQRMKSSLTAFETALASVVEHVDCEDAFSFINKIIEKSNKSLERNTLTKAQRTYHTKVKLIAIDALKQLDGCSD